MRRTPLHSLHLELGARVVPFAGYEMPVNYADGILAEHLHTRRAAGLFDVSHMGQIRVPGGGAAAALEALMPSDLLALPPGRQKYGLLTNPEGGIRDDLMVQNLGECFVLVVNAACKQPDLEYLQQRLGGGGRPELDEDAALLAVQGPASGAVLADCGHDLADMRFMDVRELAMDGIPCTVSRSGYTGEDGFEISLPAARAERLARRLLRHPSLKPIGLGARDSLRLEAGLCLYGHDITAATTPVEAGLNWAISPARRAAGARPGGFPGAGVILAQMPGNVSRLRVGLSPDGRAPVREGAELLDADGKPAGQVTSGGFSPSLGRPISMGYVKIEHAAAGAPLQAQVRGKPAPLTVAELPFVAHRFYRYSMAQL